jgi:hypothetical protein
MKESVAEIVPERRQLFTKSLREASQILVAVIRLVLEWRRQNIHPFTDQITCANLFKTHEQYANTRFYNNSVLRFHELTTD